MIKKLGLQLYTIRDFMTTEDDIKRSFEKMKKLGYDQAQTAGINPAVDHETFGKLAKDAGIEIVGTHEPLDFNMEDIDRTLKNHQALGQLTAVSADTGQETEKPGKMALKI